MSLDPTCTVDGLATPVVVAASSTITIALASPAGALYWSVSCTSTDELNSAESINETLSIDIGAKTATCTLSAVLGSAYIFTSTVGILGLGLDANGVLQKDFSTTFKVNVKAANLAVVLAEDETFEQNAAAGWVAVINPILRSASGSFPSGTGLVQVDDGVVTALSDGTASQILSMSAGSSPVREWVTLTGDGTLTAGELEVTGLLLSPLPALPASPGGLLGYNGSAWAFETTASIFTPGADLAGNATSTATDQYVSSISYDAEGFAHGVGGAVAVNGTATALNWLDNAATLEHTGTPVVSLGQASGDFVAFGPSPASTGFLRIPNGSWNILENANGVIMWMASSGELVIGSNGGILGEVDIETTGIIYQLATTFEFAAPVNPGEPGLIMILQPYVGGAHQLTFQEDADTITIQQAPRDEDAQAATIQVLAQQSWQDTTPGRTYTTGGGVVLRSGSGQPGIGVAGTIGLSLGSLELPDGNGIYTMIAATESVFGQRAITLGYFDTDGNYVSPPAGSGDNVVFVNTVKTTPTVGPEAATGTILFSDGYHLWVQEAQPGALQFQVKPQLTEGTGLTISGDTISLATTGVTAGTYGSSTTVPVISVNAEGQLTAVTTATISSSGVTWAADLVNSTDTDQYVSGISYNASGAAHGAGGTVAVNGTATVLDWIDRAATIQQAGTSVLELGQASTDFVAFGASPATSSFLRIPSGSQDLLSSPEGLLLWMASSTELTIGTNSGALDVVDIWAGGILNLQAEFIDLLFVGGAVACEVEFDVSPPAIAWRYTAGTDTTWYIGQAISDVHPGLIQLEGAGAYPGATSFTTGQAIVLASGPASVPGTTGLAGPIILCPGGENSTGLWVGETSPGEMVVALNIQSGSAFASSGRCPTGIGNYVSYWGYAASNPTADPVSGLLLYGDSSDGHFHVREADGTDFAILPATTGVSAGTYGASSEIATITVNSSGQISSITDAPLTIGAALATGYGDGSVTLSSGSLFTVAGAISVTTGASCFIIVNFTFTSSDSKNNDVFYGVGVNTNTSITYVSSTPINDPSAYGSTPTNSPTVTEVTKVFYVTGLTAGGNSFYLLAQLNAAPVSSTAIDAAAQGFVLA